MIKIKKKMWVQVWLHAGLAPNDRSRGQKEPNSRSQEGFYRGNWKIASALSVRFVVNVI